MNIWHEWGKEKCAHFFFGRKPETGYVTGLGVGGITTLKFNFEGTE